MQTKSNSKLYLFVGVLIVLGIVLAVLRLRTSEETAPPDNTKGLAEWAITPADQEAWRAKANPQLTYEEVSAHPVPATHQVVCWTGRMQEVIHVQNQQALLVTYQGVSSQTFAALMPDRSRLDWKTPAKGVRIQLCGEVMGLDQVPTITMGNQYQPIIRTGFYVEQVGS